jgi:hypothetical protein
VPFGSEPSAAANLVAEDTFMLYGQKKKLDALETTVTEL